MVDNKNYWNRSCVIDDCFGIAFPGSEYCKDCRAKKTIEQERQYEFY